MNKFDPIGHMNEWLETQGKTWDDVMRFEAWGTATTPRDLSDEELVQWILDGLVTSQLEVVWDNITQNTPDELEAYKQYLHDFWSSQRSVGKGQA